MRRLIPVPMEHEAVCQCGHGESLHRPGACNGCLSWEEGIPWRDEACRSFLEAGRLPVGPMDAAAGGRNRTS